MRTIVHNGAYSIRWW